MLVTETLVERDAQGDTELPGTGGLLSVSVLPQCRSSEGGCGEAVVAAGDLGKWKWPCAGTCALVMVTKRGKKDCFCQLWGCKSLCLSTHGRRF